MKKKTVFLTFIFTALFSIGVFAQSVTYTVQSGDSLWKIAVKYQVGFSELRAANPNITNPRLIYPGQKITVPTQTAVKSLESEVIRLVNVERSKRGLSALKANWELGRVARYKSQDMINKNYFSHTSPTYGSPFAMMESFGIKYTSAGENIAHGQQTPQEVMNAWMNSTGHRENILSSSFSEIGVGLAKNKNGTCYWTQMFIRPMK